MTKTDPCESVRKALTEGEPLGEAERAHVRSCPVCEVLSDADGQLARTLQQDLPTSGADELLASLTPMLEEEDRRPTAWLARLPTSARIGLAMLVGALTVVAVATIRPRSDLGDYPMARQAGILSALAVVAVLALGAALRPLYRARLGAGAKAAVGLAALLVVTLVAATALPSDYAPSLQRFGYDAFHCMGSGGLFAVPFIAMILAVRRESTSLPWAAAAAAGLIANAALFVFCPIEDVGHQFAGHASLVVLFMVLAVAASQRRSH